MLRIRVVAVVAHLFPSIPLALVHSLLEISTPPYLLLVVVGVKLN